MARPKTGNKKEEILAAATELVAAYGCAVSVRQIAERAGVGNGTVFLYFANKEALFDQLRLCLDEGKARWTAGRHPLPAPQVALRERLHACWNGHIDWALAHPLEHQASTRLADAGAPDHGDPLGCGARILDEMRDEMRASAALGDRPVDYFAAVFRSLGDVAIRFSASHPADAERYKNSGFDAAWSVLAGLGPSDRYTHRRPGEGRDPSLPA
jgi:AcrR family transcriptional regulator